MLRKLKWQIPGEPFKAQYNWCQGPVPGRGPAVEKHCYMLLSCVQGHHHLFTSRFAVIWLRYEPWILNTSIEHYCCISLFGKMWSCEYGGWIKGHNWSKHWISRILKLLASNTNTAWLKKMDSISYVYISWTIHGMWMIYITFEREGPKFLNTTAGALA